MAQQDFEPPRPPIPFVGRADDLAWLEERIPGSIRLGSESPIAITGVPGIGKTSLVAEHAFRHHDAARWFWIDFVSERADRDYLIERFDGRNWLDNRGGSERLRRAVVVMDGCDSTRDRNLDAIFATFRNRKDVSQIIVTSRRPPDLRVYETRELLSLSAEEMESLLQHGLGIPEITEEEYLQLQGALKGNPAAARIVAGMAQSLSSDQLRRILSGKIYDLSDVGGGIAPAQVARVLKPLIIVDNERLIRALKKQPKDLFNLTSRQFEEVIADLLQDMDYDVTLTKQTRDGGKDILASKKTELGDVLCLVDTKKYKQSRKIGVGMVRTLLGTLDDYGATNAMLATTSSFSPDAQAMQEKHKFRLSLKDYTDVVAWIQQFRA
jgi:hypothetical protein